LPSDSTKKRIARLVASAGMLRQVRVACLSGNT
jgi:hypothetical protein